MLPKYVSAESLLMDLGITEPKEIELELIAQHCNATVIYESLTGCEARIIGVDDRAIITVNATSKRSRQRFSAAHELGHWMRDSGTVGFSCTEAVLRSEWTAYNPERAANEYAADLLLPQFLFVPRAKNRDITFNTVKDLASEFDAGLIATSIRLVKYGSFPAMLVFLENGKRKWFIRGEDIPGAIWPNEAPTEGTVAYDIIKGAKYEDEAVEINASGWISHSYSERYSVVEHSIPIGKNQILALLWWENESQLVNLVRDRD